MSVEVTRVLWRKKLEPATVKFVFMCLCDHARPDGTKTYPTVQTIMMETGLSERMVYAALKRLRSDNLLVVTAPHSRKKNLPTHYAVNVDALNALPDLPKARPSVPPTEGELSAYDAESDELTASGAVDDCIPCTQNHQYNHHSNDLLPSVGDSAGLKKLSIGERRQAHQFEQEQLAAQHGIQVRGLIPLGVPAVQMVMAYHHYLPTLPRCIAISTDRAKKLSARWKDCGEKADAWRHVLVDKIAPSAFLNGRSPPRSGAEPFRATLDWIIGPENFIKIVEGKYVHGQAPDYSSVQ